MYSVIRPGEIQPSPGGTVKFEGEAYGGGVSFFLVNNRPGDGPDLHRHPYSETWVVRSGKVRITADGENLEAGPGDIIVVTGETRISSRTSEPTGWKSCASIPHRASFKSGWRKKLRILVIKNRRFPTILRNSPHRF